MRKSPFEKLAPTIMREFREGVLKMPNTIYTTHKNYVVCVDCGDSLEFEFIGSEMRIQWHDCPEHPSAEPLPPDDHSNHLKDQYGGCVKDSRGNCISDDSTVVARLIK